MVGLFGESSICMRDIKAWERNEARKEDSTSRKCKCVVCVELLCLQNIGWQSTSPLSHRRQNTRPFGVLYFHKRHAPHQHSGIQCLWFHRFLIPDRCSLHGSEVTSFGAERVCLVSVDHYHSVACMSYACHVHVTPQRHNLARQKNVNTCAPCLQTTAAYRMRHSRELCEMFAGVTADFSCSRRTLRSIHDWKPTSGELREQRYVQHTHSSPDLTTSDIQVVFLLLCKITIIVTK